jgi:hypothetical protein
MMRKNTHVGRVRRAARRDSMETAPQKSPSLSAGMVAGISEATCPASREQFALATVRRSMAHITTRPASSPIGNTGTLFDRP